MNLTFTLSGKPASRAEVTIALGQRVTEYCVKLALTHWDQLTTETTYFGGPSKELTITINP